MSSPQTRRMNTIAQMEQTVPALAPVEVLRRNLAWALAYNVLVLPLAVTGHLPPWLAALGMSASSLVVVGNALRASRIEGHGEEGA